MLVLDSSAIIDYSNDRDTVVGYIDGRGPFLTSAICVYEVVVGKMWATGKSAHTVREGFGGVRSLELNEEIALEAARIQVQLRDRGAEMPVRDLLVAATARSTGAELVVADDDFTTDPLQELLRVTNLHE
jgi:predicted nucleic acid-binding protein